MPTPLDRISKEVLAARVAELERLHAGIRVVLDKSRDDHEIARCIRAILTGQATVHLEPDLRGQVRVRIVGLPVVVHEVQGTDVIV